MTSAGKAFAVQNVAWHLPAGLVRDVAGTYGTCRQGMRVDGVRGVFVAVSRQALVPGQADVQCVSGGGQDG